MPVLTMAPTLGDLVKWEDNANFSREVVTFPAGGPYPLGLVTAKLTATGKTVAWNPGGSGGAEVVSGVSLVNVTTIAADVQGVALARESIVSRAMLVWGSGVTTQTQKDTGVAALQALGIVARTTA